MKNDIPNPGSPEARNQGCRCAVLDNHHGRGYMMQPDVFVVSGDCPLHGESQNPDIGVVPS